MKKISGFQIISLSVKGFKCFGEEKKFIFGPLTYVTGDNYQGKSSIADAIAYAITGTPFFGDRGLDRLLNDNATEIEVSVELMDDDGQRHELIRARKNDTTAISFDGYKVSQANLTEVFGEKDVFLSLFNPKYFIKTLGADKRDMLQKMLPFVEHERILACLDEGTRTLLENEKLLSPEIYIKNRRDEIKECEESVLYLQGQDDLIDSQKKDAEKALIAVDEELEQIWAELDKLDVLLNEGCSEKEIEEQLVELHRRKEEIMQDKPTDQECQQLSQIVFDIKLELEQKKAQLFESPHATEIKEKEMMLKVLYSDYQNITSIKNGIKPGFHCPTCLQTITEDGFEAAENEVQKGLTECVQHGKQMKQEIAMLQSEEIRLAANYEKALAVVIAGIENRIILAQDQLLTAKDKKKTDDEAYEKVLEEINKQIQMTEQSGEYGNLSAEQIVALEEMRSKRDGLLAKRIILEETVNQPDKKEEIKKTESEIQRLKVLVNAAGIYVGKKNELLFSGLKLNRVKIVLHEIVKSTGEIKDAFLLTYQGRIYENLSKSEEIKTGLELTELIKSLSGRRYPTFIDDCESVTSIDNVKPSGQVFISRVVKGMQLSVTNKPVGVERVVRAIEQGKSIERAA